jgi:hypothetical protein
MNTLFGLQATAWFRSARARGLAVSLETVKRLRLPGLPFVGERPDRLTCPALTHNAATDDRTTDLSSCRDWPIT